jgi:cytoskeletal protein RodZ
MGLTLEQIAAETRIGTRFLEAIESEQFHLLPGGIFSRGFVRTYAEQLKLDPDQAVADFERQSSYREPTVDAMRVSAPQPNKRNQSLYPIAIGILVALVIVVYLTTREQTKPVDANQPPVETATPVATPAPEPAPQTVTPAPVPPAPPTGSTEETSPQPSPSAVPATPETSKKKLTIVLSARQTTWIKVRTDGASINGGEILQPGATRRYTAQASIGLSVGNAGGVDIQVNDHPLRPLGPNGRVRSITITPENLKDLL